MKLHRAERWSLIEADCVAALRKLPANRFDSVVTDPPYELGFMGKKWDASGIAYSLELWREVLRVLKPGGHLLAFGGTRTYHRMTCAIEDSGFEVRDSLHWLYGTGFPKGKTAASGMPEGQGTALKPAHEPIVMARKPLIGTIEANVAAHGTGGLQIDACRIALDSAADPTRVQNCQTLQDGHTVTLNVPGHSQPTYNTVGRWPANVLLDEDAAAELDAQSGTLKSGAKAAYEKPNGLNQVYGRGFGGMSGSVASEGGASRFFFVVRGDLCSACANDAESRSTAEPLPAGGSAQSLARAGLSLDTSTPPASTSGTPSASKQSGASGTPTIPSSGSEFSPASPLERLTPKTCRACGVGIQSQTDTTKTTIGPSTSSESAAGVTSGNTSPSSAPGVKDYAPFRYVAKPSRAERDQGCGHLPARTGGEATDREDGSAGTQNPRAGAGRTGGARNHHPTVKPVELMRYLVRLVTPPGGTVLDPFTGSGTTGMAALLEGVQFVGLEREAEYITIAKARIGSVQIPDSPVKP